MSRRPPAATWISRASVLSTGALLIFSCWIGCELDRSGLSSGVAQPSASGGSVVNSVGSGGVGAGTGGLFGATGGSGVHFGSGGTGSGGRGTEETGGSGGQVGPGPGGSAGVVVVASGGNGGAGQGAGGHVMGPGPGGDPMPPDKGGKAGQSSAGGAGARTGGRGGANTGSGGWGWGTGGASGTLPMCDASIRDKDTCDFGTADCRKTCGVSELGTKPCTCTNRQWNCGDCAYPSGDYTCYELPVSGQVPACPANTINGMTSCFGNCTLCANYTDTSGVAKMGYCACNQDPGDRQRLYHCASSAEWPPQ